MGPSAVIHILYATATGTAEEVSETVAQELNQLGSTIATFCRVDEYSLSNLPLHSSRGDVFIFIISTCGDGEPPGNMQNFWRFFRRSDLPTGILTELRFTIFGLGDRAYVKFNAAARMLCTRLVDLGAKLIVPISLGDDSAPGGYETELRVWMEGVTRGLFGEQNDVKREMKVDLKQPRVCVDMKYHFNKIERNPDLWQRGQSVHQATENISSIFEAVVSQNRVVTNSELLKDDKEVRHIELDVSQSVSTTGLHDYTPGDIIHIMPRNKPSAVSAFFELTNLDGTQMINIRTIQAKNRFAEYRLNIRTPCTLYEFVSAQMDLTCTPRRSFFERLAPFATDKVEGDKLNELASIQGADDLAQYCFREKRTVLLVLRDFKSARPPLEHLVDMIPRLKARPFSIASCAQKHKGRIHICASMVRYTTPLRFVRVGVCSSFLERIQKDDVVPVFLERGTSLRFRTDQPAIMIAPGTGVAPMRSYIHSIGRNTKENVLIFGCRNNDADFLYKEEWGKLIEDGALKKLYTAFSREDPNQKFYVQDRLLKEKSTIWNLLVNANAYVYIAGMAGAMPKAVRESLIEICQTEGKMSLDSAKQFIQRLISYRRIQIECW